MMWYVLICLCMSLAGAAGLQFLYLAYLEKIDGERKNRIKEMERHIRHLKRQLASAEMRINEKDRLLQDVPQECEPEEDEVWADVIEEK